MPTSPMGYQGFENPMYQYYGANPTLPVLYTGAWQTRQFGVGGCTTLGGGKDITLGLATVPANMSEAVTVSTAAAKVQYLHSNHDIEYYGTTT